MLEVDANKNITLSEGDCLNLEFSIQGITLDATDEIVFSVKRKLDDAGTLIRELATIDTETNSFEIYITDLGLGEGLYYYDVVYKSASCKRTLCFPARIKIARVVHNE